MNVSVIIATYGDELWSEIAWSRAYSSVLEQGAHEILIEHDSAGDVTQPRNRLAERAGGTHLLFLDADDELAPGYIDAMTHAWGALLETFSNAPVLLTPRVSYVAHGRRKPPKFWPESDLVDTNWLVIGTVVPRALFLGIGGFRLWEQGLFDWDLWVRCVQAGAKIRKVPEAIYLAHVNRQSEHHLLRRDRERYSQAYHTVRRSNWPHLYAEESH